MGEQCTEKKRRANHCCGAEGLVVTQGESIGLSLPVIAVIWNAPTFNPESGYRSTVGHELISVVFGLVLLGGLGFLWYAWQRFLSN